MAKPVAQHYPVLDVFQLLRVGLFSHEKEITWVWPNGLEATLQVIGKELKIQAQRPKEAEGLCWNIPLKEDHSAGFGGIRHYFVCPSCEKQRYKLRISNGRWACAQCHGMCHITQTMSPEARVLRRMKKIRYKMGNHGDVLSPFPSNKRYMHTKTYQNLKNLYTHLLEQYDALAFNTLFQQRIARLLHSLGWSRG